jgi:uncharacterized protein
LVLDPDRPAWLLVNDDGLRILECCNGKRSAEEIARIVVEKMDGGVIDDIVTQVKDFLQLADNHYLFKNRTKAAPQENRFRGIALEITARCNIHCIHCYLDAGAQKSASRELTLPAILDILRSVKKAGGVSVAIGGGEPFLREDCFDIIDAALDEGLLVSVGTNGTLLDCQTVDRLSRRPVKIQVSLDGASAEIHDMIRGPGTFAATVQGIDRLVEAGKGGDICLACTVVQLNVGEVPALIDFALERGIPVIQFPPLAAAGRAGINYERLHLQRDELVAFWRYVSFRAGTLKGKMDLLADCFSLSIDRAGTPYRCTIGTQLRIDPWGNVYPCQCFHGGGEFCLGNVTVTPLEEIVVGERIQEIIELCERRPQEIDVCHECRWMNFCGGGCMGNAYEANGTIYMPQGCEARKKWLEAQLAARVAGI